MMIAGSVPLSHAMWVNHGVGTFILTSAAKHLGPQNIDLNMMGV